MVYIAVTKLNCKLVYSAVTELVCTLVYSAVTELVCNFIDTAVTAIKVIRAVAVHRVSQPKTGATYITVP